MRELTPELRALHDLARAAAQGTQSVEDLLARICENVVETFGFERASIVSLDEDETLSPVASQGVALEELPTGLPLDSQPLLVRALETAETVFVRDARSEEVVSPEVIEAFGVTSVVAIPLITEGKCLGFLGADRAGEVFDLDQPTLDLLSTIGAVAAVYLAQALEHKALRRLDALKTNFIALASHELRTPAAVVHGIAATLHQRGDQLTEEQLRQLRRALYEQTDRLRSLVEQLLDLSRLEAEGISIAPERVSVHRRVQELALVLGGDRARLVEVAVEPELEAVVDATAFDRILSNLITNAFKYGSPPIVVSARQSDNHFRLSVEDHGEGVPQEFVPDLFERFTRGRDTKKEHGAGLGLSIAQQYAEAHGGRILYRPASPQGACFEFVLPNRASAAAPSPGLVAAEE